MKVILVCLILCGLLGASLAWNKCEKQTDCDDDECCLDNMFFKSPYCEKRYGAGQKCVANSLYKRENDIYYFTCPCVPRYECLGKGSLDENGNTVMKNPKCIMPLV